MGWGLASTVAAGPLNGFCSLKYTHKQCSVAVYIFMIQQRSLWVDTKDADWQPSNDFSIVSLGVLRHEHLVYHSLFVKKAEENCLNFFFAFPLGRFLCTTPHFVISFLGHFQKYVFYQLQSLTLNGLELFSTHEWECPNS